MNFMRRQSESEMNNELLTKYFSDNQLAAILGITLGGLRNKLYRIKEGSTELPRWTEVTSRTRLWLKSGVRDWLLKTYDNTEEIVDKLMSKGEATDPGGAFASKSERMAKKAATARNSKLAADKSAKTAKPVKPTRLTKVTKPKGQ